MSNNDDFSVITGDIASKLLRCLSSDRADDYNDWIQVCILFKNNYPDLYNDFDTWSKSSKNYNAKQNKKLWDGIKSKSGGLTVGTLMHWAKEDNKREFNKVITYVKNKQFEEAIEKSKDELENWYNTTKWKVQQKWFKLNHPLKYCRFYKGEIQAYSPKEAQEFFKPINIKINTNGKKKTHYFFDMWSNDEFIKTYEGIVFDPENNDPLFFNTFTGFDMYDDCEPECVPEFDELIKHIFVTEENINYFYSWMNHILTKPHIKTGRAIILYSDIHGVGKNTLVELIMKLIGSKYCSKLNKIEDISANFNSHLTQKLFIYGDEIRSRATDLSSELKNVITQTEVLHTKKFMDSYKMKDLANFLFTTNEEIAFRIEKHDRRFFCVEIINAKPKEFYDMFYKALEDEEKIMKFFSYIYNYKNIVDLKNIPETNYKNKIKSFSMDAVEHYLYNKVSNYAGDKVNVKTFYDNIINNAKENKITYNISRDKVKETMDKLMNIKVDNIQIVKKRDMNNIKYIFPKKEIMIEILRRYNSSLYKHCGLDEEVYEEDDETCKIFNV